MPSTPWEQFKFGLCFGMGLAIALAVLQLIGELIKRAHF